MVLGMCALFVVTTFLQSIVRTKKEEHIASVSILGQSLVNPQETNSTKSTTTNYGEVWLIRHGEKDDDAPLMMNDTSSIMRTMYELNDKGWDRAHHLVSLTRARLAAAVFRSRGEPPSHGA